MSVAATDAFALVTAQGARVTSAAVALQDRVGGCGDYGVSRDRPGTSKLKLQMYVNPSSGQSLAPGTYSVGSSGGVFVDALLSRNDATCTNTLVGSASKAISGSVTFTTFQPSAIGTFDLVFPGGRMFGSFDAPQCTKNPASTATCVP